MGLWRHLLEYFHSRGVLVPYVICKYSTNGFNCRESVLLLLLFVLLCDGALDRIQSLSLRPSSTSREFCPGKHHNPHILSLETLWSMWLVGVISECVSGNSWLLIVSALWDDIIRIKMIEAHQISVFCTLPSGIQKTDTMLLFKYARIIFLNAFFQYSYGDKLVCWV